MVVGGSATWLIVYKGEHAIYHAGDTNVFSEMSIINDMYKPTHLLLPIGGHFTMGPREAAFAVCKFLTHAQHLIPMHFETFPLLKGNPSQLKAELENFYSEFERK